MSLKVETGEVLKSLRVLAKYKPEELAKKINISRSWVYRVEEKDGPSPTLDIVKNWVKACKPKGDITDWLSLSSQLLYEDKVVLEIEKQAEVVTENKVVPKWFVDLLPRRFLKTIK